MYPSGFVDYRRPSSLGEALELARLWGEDAIYIAGGMSLMQAMKSRLLSPEYLIDLNGIAELRGINASGKCIRIGAMTRYREVATSSSLGPFQALADAAGHVGDRQVRNRGTVGGSLAWNYVSACTPIAALACGANVLIMHPDSSTSSYKIDDFQQGPLTTALQPNDLLYCIELAKPRHRAGSAYRKWGIVKDALPVIGFGCYLEIDGQGRCLTARIAIGGLENGPERASEAEQQMVGELDLEDPAIITKIARTASESTSTAGDHWVSAEYKSHLIERLGSDVLSLAVLRAKEIGHG